LHSDAWFPIHTVGGKSTRQSGQIHLRILYVWDKIADDGQSHKVFGRSLDDIIRRETPLGKSEAPAPQLVLQAIKFLSGFLKTEGIFRISGNAREVKELQLLADIGRHNWAELKTSEYNVAALLKSFLRDLPEPVLTPSDKWLALTELNDGPEKIERLKTLFNGIPTTSQRLVRVLIPFLLDVIAHEQDNKMSIKNLSICIAPNLIKIADNENPLTAVRVPMIMVDLLQHSQAIL
jgi:RalA-binding protein 1